MPIHNHLNEHIIRLQQEFRNGDGKGAEEVSEVFVLSSSALTRACGVALLKQARWSVREAGRLVALTDMIYGDVRQVIKRQQQDTIPSGYASATSNLSARLAGSALDISTDATIAGAVATRNCHKGESNVPASPPSSKPVEGNVPASYPILPSGMKMSKMVLVDAILHETPEAVSATLRTLQRQTGVRLVLCYFTDERPTAGLGYKLHASCSLSEGDLYEEGYDLVIQQCLDHSTIRMITGIFVPQSKQFERGVAAGARTVTGNYAKIRHILGEVTDRTGARTGGAASVGGGASSYTDQFSLTSSPMVTRGKKEALQAAVTVGPSTEDCIDTHPDYLKVLARYEHSLLLIESLRRQLSTTVTADSNLEVELEGVRGELTVANSKIAALTDELEGLRRSELLVDQVIHTSNRVRDAHMIKALQASMATVKDKLATSLNEIERQSLEIKRLQDELESSNVQLLEAKRQPSVIPSSRRVSLFTRPQLPTPQPPTPNPEHRFVNKAAIADFCALLEQANLLARDVDGAYVLPHTSTYVNVPTPNEGRRGPSLTFADAANRRRSQNHSLRSESAATLALSSSMTIPQSRSIATQTAAQTHDALPLFEVEEYLQVLSGSLSGGNVRPLTTSDAMDAVTAHIVSHLATTLKSGGAAAETPKTNSEPGTCKGSSKGSSHPHPHISHRKCETQPASEVSLLPPPTEDSDQHQRFTDSPTIDFVPSSNNLCGGRGERRHTEAPPSPSNRVPRGPSTPRSGPFPITQAHSERTTLNPPPPLPAATASRFIIRHVSNASKQL